MSSALLITERKGQVLSLLYHENRLVKVKAQEDGGSEISDSGTPKEEGEMKKNASLMLGSIYIGKIKNVVPSVDAAFVEVKKDMMGFLPLKKARNPILTNRHYDGRLLAGDEILVQVEKEAIKTKEPGLTCNLSFTGKYLVLTTGKQTLGFSSKLLPETKEIWKQKIQKLKLDETLRLEKSGMIVRTNVVSLMCDGSAGIVDNMQSVSKEPALKATADEICFMEEFKTLSALKNKVLSESSYRTCFSCLLQPLEGFLTDIRDSYENSYDKIITDSPFIYEKIRENFPAIQHLELYQDSQMPLSKLYSVETRLKEALDEKVWLKSGAYLMIQQTEALTVIDVNSGKIQKKHPKDDIYYKINREAAREIALQLTLRNLSGIIIIDFISQNTKEQDQQLLSFLKGLVKMDSVKTDVIDMTPLGLVEITRKKIHKSLQEQLKNI